NAFQYETEHYSSDTPGNDQWGDFKPRRLRNTLPLYIDNLLYSDKRDVFYGVTFTWN
ncbi:MAG: hypothetical protein IH971_06300, partial [Candidatus Marinimicrobia bacterium]|nr:hypothetical protein [Candidatus Neomarinimicrobiota bacterium]